MAEKLKTKTGIELRWYNDACRKARNKLKRATSKLNKNPFNTSYQEKAVAARKEYKKICKQTESRHRKDEDIIRRKKPLPERGFSIP